MILANTTQDADPIVWFLVALIFCAVALFAVLIMLDRYFAWRNREHEAEGHHPLREGRTKTNMKSWPEGALRPPRPAHGPPPQQRNRQAPLGYQPEPHPGGAGNPPTGGSGARHERRTTEQIQASLKTRSARDSVAALERLLECDLPWTGQTRELIKRAIKLQAKAGART